MGRIWHSTTLRTISAARRSRTRPAPTVYLAAHARATVGHPTAPIDVSAGPERASARARRPPDGTHCTTAHAQRRAAPRQRRRGRLRLRYACPRVRASWWGGRSRRCGWRCGAGARAGIRAGLRSSSGQGGEGSGSGSGKSSRGAGEGNAPSLRRASSTALRATETASQQSQRHG
jgi:hypothetical protein